MIPVNRITNLDFRIAIIPVVVLCVYPIFQTAHFLPHDFSNSYFPARFFLDGDFTKDIFDPYFFNKKIFDSGTKDVFACFTPNPPSVGILFVPFALLPLIPAKIVFDIISVLAFFISVYRLCRFMKVPPSLVFLFFPFVFFMPLRNNLLFGQTYLLVVSLLIEGYLAHENKKTWLSALFWTLAIFLKVFPGVVVLFLLARRKYREALILTGCCVSFFFICVVFQGVDVWRYYLLEVLPRSSAGDINSAYTTSMQSVTMLLKFLFDADALANPHPFVDNQFLPAVILSLFTSMILACGIWAARNLSNSLLALGILLLGVQLISPQGSTYSNLMLILILIALYREEGRKELVIVSVLVLLISNVPVGLFQELPLVFRFPRLILLIVLFVALCVFNRILPDKKLVLILVLISGTPAIIKAAQNKAENDYFVADTAHPLIYDYGVENGNFYYVYWDSNGPNKIVTTQGIKSLDTKDVSIVDGQVFYRGMEVTKTPGNKLKPAVINDSQIIFLSDEGRGIGFYAVRSIEIDGK